MKLVFFVSIFGVKQLLQMRTITKTSGKRFTLPSHLGQPIGNVYCKIKYGHLGSCFLIETEEEPCLRNH